VSPGNKGAAGLNLTSSEWFATYTVVKCTLGAGRPYLRDSVRLTVRLSPIVAGVLSRSVSDESGRSGGEAAALGCG